MTCSIEEIRELAKDDKNRQPEPSAESTLHNISSLLIISSARSNDPNAPSVASEQSIADHAPIETPLSAVSPQVVAPAVPAYKASSPPMSAKSLSRIIKISISATILLVGSYFAAKNAYPLLMELAHPGSIKSGQPGDKPTSVKLLQQTRNVVAKNNANVDNLNTIIQEELGVDKSAATATKLPELPTPPQQFKPKPELHIRLEKLSNIVIDELHVSSVLGGAKPQITVDGLIISLGGVVDYKRRLRFLSLDEANHIIVFGNGQETIEKSY